MTRGAKKFVYGILYLFIFGVLAYWIFGGSRTVPPHNAPSSIQDQAIPITVSGPVQIFKDGGLSRTTLLANVTNKNADYGVKKLDYAFALYDKGGALVDQIRGFTTVFPGESKYILGSYEGTPYNIERISRADLSFFSPEWVLGSELIASHLAVAGKPVTTIADNGIRITGSVENSSPLTTGTVKVIAILYNKYDDPIFAGQTLLEKIRSLDSAPFSVYFPPDPVFVEKLDPSRTKVFVSTGE